MSDNLTIKDGDGASKLLRTTEAAGVHTPHHILEGFESSSEITRLPAQHIDAFSRLRVSAPGYRFDSQFTYRIDSDLWDRRAQEGVSDVADVSESITHDATNRMAAVVAGTADSANTSILQSHYHAPYTAGRSQLALLTFFMPGTVPANGEVGCGYYDGSNGVYLKRTATTVSLHLDTTTDHPDATVLQAAWNIDPMDGTGPSGCTLDLTKTQILVIQMQALYAGRVVVGFDIDGDLIPVHEFNHSNNAAFPYIAQASLPLRFWAFTSSDASAATINAICGSVISEGGQDLQAMDGRQFVMSGELDDANPKRAILSIKPTINLNGIAQNVLAIPTEVDVAIAGAGAWIEIRRNSTILTGNFFTVDAASVMEFCNLQSTTPLVATLDTGTLVDKFYVPANKQSRTSDSSGLLGKALIAWSHLLADSDNLTVFIDGENATDAFVAVKWKEIA